MIRARPLPSSALAVLLAVGLLDASAGCSHPSDSAGAAGSAGAPVSRCTGAAPPPLGVATPDAIYPRAAYAVVGGGAGASVKAACVDTSRLASHATLDALLPVLVAEAGLALGSAAAGDCGWALLFAGAEPALSGDAASAWAAAGSSEERYQFVTRVEAGKASTTLFAPGERGALYALRVALSLTTADAKDPASRAVAEASVVDYPAFASRGIVEGFYGAAYTAGDRATLLSAMARLRENTYIYGPKCDCYASQGNWRDPYPMGEVPLVDPTCICIPCQPISGLDIQAAARKAAANLIRFVWALSPLHGKPYSFKPKDLGALKAKIDAMRPLGVQHFALFIDDTYGTPDPAQHADLMNAVDDYLVAADPAEHLLVVGTTYRGAPDAYTDALGKALHPRIEVMWTGNDVEPATIAAADLTAINQSLGRPVSIWDNWPTTPQAFVGRAADVATSSSGFYTNPVMSECTGPPADPSGFLQVLGPIADYLWSPGPYVAAPDASHARWQSALATETAPAPVCMP